MMNHQNFNVVTNPFMLYLTISEIERCEFIRPFQMSSNTAPPFTPPHPNTACHFQVRKGFFLVICVTPFTTDFRIPLFLSVTRSAILGARTTFFVSLKIGGIGRDDCSNFNYLVTRWSEGGAEVMLLIN